MKKLDITIACLCFLVLAIIGTVNLGQALADTAAPAEQQSSIIPHWLRMFIDPPVLRKPPTDQDKAVLQARDGKYDEALATLDRLHRQDPANQSVTRDYIAVLGWAGRDQDAIDLYQTLMSQQPDYMLAAVAHSYRKLNQPDQALNLYRAGLQQYPSNVIFAEGEIRCLVDENKLDEALAKANADLAAHGDRPEIVAAKQDIQKAIQDAIQVNINKEDQRAVDLARNKHYPEALVILSDLHTQHPDDLNVTRDYLAVLGWAGGHDAQVVALYKTLPAGDEPDYVLEAVGHAYRKLHQSNDALAVYQQGIEKYPDSVIFAEGEIRCLVDVGRYDEGMAKADANLATYGKRPEIVDIKKNITRVKPKPHRRKGR